MDQRAQGERSIEICGEPIDSPERLATLPLRAANLGDLGAKLQSGAVRAFFAGDKATTAAIDEVLADPALPERARPLGLCLRLGLLRLRAYDRVVKEPADLLLAGAHPVGRRMVEELARDGLLQRWLRAVGAPALPPELEEPLADDALPSLWRALGEPSPSLALEGGAALAVAPGERQVRSTAVLVINRDPIRATVVRVAVTPAAGRGLAATAPARMVVPGGARLTLPVEITLPRDGRGRFAIEVAVSVEGGGSLGARSIVLAVRWSRGRRAATALAAAALALGAVWFAASAALPALVPPTRPAPPAPPPARPLASSPAVPRAPVRDRIGPRDGGGSYLDALTRLAWQSRPSAYGLSLSDAKAYCARLSIDGRGFRLPTALELASRADEDAREGIARGLEFWALSDGASASWSRAGTGGAKPTSLPRVRCVR